MQTKGSNKNKDLSVSARKLAATLREINGVAASKVNEDLEEKNDVELVKKERILKSSKLGSVALQFSDPFHAPVSEVSANFARKIGSCRSFSWNTM